MAEVVLTYVEDEEDGMTHCQTMAIGRNGVEDIHDMLNFLSDAIRAAGYTQYDRVGVATNKGAVTWSSF
jgi:hypothetical protein